MSQNGGIFNLQLLVTFRRQLSYFPHTMLVIVRGDPAFTKTEVIGLDILAPRHPKLYGLIVNRLGYDVNSTTHVVSNRQGLRDNFR
jgi:hypothetical protein